MMTAVRCARQVSHDRVVKRRRKPLKRLRIILVVLFVLIVVIPIAYFAAKYNPRPAALSPEQALAEYRAEEASLTLAPGWKWPASPVPFQAPDGTAYTYEVGWGRRVADLDWFCSWASRAADPQLPAPERQQALENVFSIRTKYYYTAWLAAEPKLAFDQALRNAAEGNMQDLRRYYETNCRKAP